MKEYKRKIKIDAKPLWRYLDLNKSFLYKQVDNAYLKIRFKNKKTQLAWKILRDQYFCRDYKKNQSTERILESGFFDDELELNFFSSINYFWKKTPIYKISNNLKRIGGNKKCAILLMTGAFSPIHRGHVLYMEAAKEEIEKRGVKIIGGYISPSHDVYVNAKDGGRAKMSARNRIMLCRKAVKNSSWLMVDGWESLYILAPVTYTLVYERLKKYLSHHFPGVASIDVYLVVGSDNAAYARPFADKGYCVCVERSNYTKTYKQILSEYKDNKKIVFVDYKYKHLKCSSSLVRRGKSFMLDCKVRNSYWKYINYCRKYDIDN